MNKYDCRHLLQIAYGEGITNNGVSVETLEKIKECLERTKPNLSCVFGVGFPEDYDDELCVFVSDASTWKDEGHCSDYADDDSFDILAKMGFCSSEDSIYVYNFGILDKDKMTREEIIAALVSYGLEYDPKFEEFMLDT